MKEKEAGKQPLCLEIVVGWEKYNGRPSPWSWARPSSSMLAVHSNGQLIFSICRCQIWEEEWSQGQAELKNSSALRKRVHSKATNICQFWEGGGNRGHLQCRCCDLVPNKKKSKIIKLVGMTWKLVYCSRTKSILRQETGSYEMDLTIFCRVAGLLQRSHRSLRGLS